MSTKTISLIIEENHPTFKADVIFFLLFLLDFQHMDHVQC